MSSRRLLNRPGGHSSTPSATTTTTTTTTVLPSYEPLAFPLNDTARRALGDLSNDRKTELYERHLGESLRLLGASTGDLHERLRLRRHRLDALRKRREERGVAEKSAEEERLEAHAAQLEDEARALTEEAEAAVRDVIDRRAEIEDEAVVLQDLYTAAAGTARTHNDQASRRRRRHGQAADAADEDDNMDTEDPPPPPPPVESTLHVYRHRRAAKLDAYSQMGMHERYAVNNDYAGFKKLWHDAAVGEDGPPLPDASRWFRRDGQPVMTAAAAQDGPEGDGDEDEDEDEDVAVARETISLNCPLTLRMMEEPYSNRKCKHTFEKSAIVEYLSQQPTSQCPQTGCSQRDTPRSVLTNQPTLPWGTQRFSKNQFDQDFYLDQAILRRIQRSKQAQQGQDMMDYDEDEDDEEEQDERSIVQGRTRVLRKPKEESA